MKKISLSLASRTSYKTQTKRTMALRTLDKLQVMVKVKPRNKKVVTLGELTLQRIRPIKKMRLTKTMTTTGVPLVTLRKPRKQPQKANLTRATELIATIMDSETLMK